MTFSTQCTGVILVNQGLPEEYTLDLIINGKKAITLICTQEALPELIAGYLYNEGIIISLDEIISLDVDEKDARANIQLLDNGREIFTHRVRLSGMAGETMHGAATSVFRPIAQKYAAAMIHKCADVMNSRTIKYNETGGIHCSALFFNKELLSIYEDIGRHNTLDKICGDCLQRNISMSDTLLVTTGRISSEMIHKASMIGVSVIASYSTPTQKAYEKALEANITLLGYLRKYPMTVYCGLERVI